MKHLLLFLLVFTYMSVSNAQETPKADLSSPFKSIRTHLFYLQDENRNDSLAALPFEPERRGMETAVDLAVKLKQVLDGNGIYVYMDEIPKESNYYDSAFNKSKFVLTEEFPDIYLVKRSNSNEWVYSDAAAAAINEAHANTFRFGTGVLLKYLPKLGHKKVMGLYVFQYIAILVLALLSAIIYKIFTFLSEKVLRRVLKTSGFKETSHESLIPIARPVSVFIIVLLLVMFVPVLQLPPSYSHYVIMGLRVMLPLMGTIIVYRFVNILAVYLTKLAERTESTLDDQMVPLLRKTLKTFVVITGTLFILENLDVPILPLLTGLSIGGLAFALAAQDTIKNFFGSLMIFIDRPFQIGDWVTSGDVDGTVEEVGFRSSRVRTFRNSLMYIPNGKLADSTIDNHGLRKYRRFYTKIGITYDTPPALMETFVEGLRMIVDKHHNTNKENYHIYFNDLGASSLEILFYIFFEVPTWSEELKARHEVLLEIMKLGEKLGVNFAFPTQTLHVENFPGKPSLSPKYLTEQEMKEELGAYFSKN
jgi:MscS family membrane protein